MKSSFDIHNTHRLAATFASDTNIHKRSFLIEKHKVLPPSRYAASFPTLEA